MSIRLIVVDDHVIVRRGLERILEDSGIEIVAEASNSEQLFSLLTMINAHIVLLDVRLGEENGLDCLTKLRELRPDLSVLMFSGFNNPTYVSKAIDRGASGFVLKDDSRERLISSIREVAAGNKVWTREELRRVTGALTTPRLESDVEAPLTQRESQVLEQLTFGQTNKEIAQSLEISYETVKEHVQHILRKVGVTDRTQAAVWAVRKGIV